MNNIAEVRENYWKINDFSKITGVSIRALQYYDSIELLSPSFRCENNYRMYTVVELNKLCRILALKSLGCNLKQIKEIFHDNLDLLQLFNIQLSNIAKKIVSLKKTETTLKYITKYFENLGLNDNDKIMQISIVLKMHKKNLFESANEFNNLNKIIDGVDYEFISKNERILSMVETICSCKKISENEHNTENDAGQEILANYLHAKNMIDNTVDEILENIDESPESDLGLKLANQWISRAVQFNVSKNNLEEYHNRNKKQSNFQNIIPLYIWGDIDDRVSSWIKDAINFLYREIGIIS